MFSRIVVCLKVFRTSKTTKEGQIFWTDSILFQLVRGTRGLVIIILLKYLNYIRIFETFGNMFSFVIC